MKMESIVYKAAVGRFEDGLLSDKHSVLQETVSSITASVSHSEVILMAGMVLLCVMMAFILRHLVRQNARIAVLEEENRNLKACSFLNGSLSKSNSRKVRQQILPEIEIMKDDFAKLSNDIQELKEKYFEFLRNDEELDNEIGQIVDLWDEDEEVSRLCRNERELAD